MRKKVEFVEFKLTGHIIILRLVLHHMNNWE